MIARALSLLFRLSLAVVFLYAGITKARSPELFALAIDAYQLLPAWAVLLLAHTLPWVEILLGLLLAVGWWRRLVSLAVTSLLGFFFIVMFITYLRGIQADCGCFGFGEPISPRTLVRDGSLLVMALFFLYMSWRRPRPLPTFSD